MSNRGPFRLLEKIKAEAIQPKPKIYFSLKSIGLWTLLFGSILLGAIAFSIVLYAYQQSGLDIPDLLAQSRTALFLALTPLLWVLFLFLFLALAIWLTRATPRGYKLTWAYIILISVLLSMTVGYICFKAGGAEYIDKTFYFSRLDLPSIENQKRKIWSNTEQGLLSGVIKEAGDSLMVLEDFRGKVWTLNISNTFIRPRVNYQAGEKIKCLGQLSPDGEYIVTEIRPWVGRKGR